MAAKRDDRQKVEKDMDAALAKNLLFYFDEPLVSRIPLMIHTKSDFTATFKQNDTEYLLWFLLCRDIYKSSM
jgi:chemotaxis methyl-accepting protein methylase